MGRAGRGGDQSVCIFLRKQGERTPPEMKPYLRQESSACLKRGMVEIFTLKDVDGENQLMYTFMQITWAKLFSFQWYLFLSVACASDTNFEFAWIQNDERRYQMISTSKQMVNNNDTIS